MARSSRLTLALVGLVAVLLVALAALQYHWIGELSRAEAEQLRRRLERSAERVARDFDRELTELFAAFILLEPGLAEGETEQRLSERLMLWRARARHPELLRDAWLAEGDPAEGIRLRRLDPSHGAFVAAEDQALARALSEDERRRGRPDRVLPDVPALVVPLFGEGGPRSRFDRTPTAVVLRLDADTIADRILPELTERHFGPVDAVEYDLAVLREDGTTVYRSAPALDARALEPADVRVGLFALRRPNERRPGPEPWRRGGRTPPGAPPPRPPGASLGRGAEDPHWTLVARHRTGSLARAVSAARRRNLAVSLGVLALLGASATLLVVGARRAERVALQQMEFVAGVTHELLTPLAAICSAGQNLADGVVGDADRVRRYGSMIQAEGRRLARTVGQVLEFAGIQSGGRVYRSDPLSVVEVVEGALAENALVLEESGLRLEKELSADLPPVRGDAAALRRAVDNLIGNAVRHAAAGGWLGVSVRGSRDGREVSIRVADRGPGIPPAERRRLFEPFFRGGGAARGGAAGSGLGLSIVKHIAEAHGGRVELESPAGGGTAFTVRLPTAAAPHAGAA